MKDSVPLGKMKCFVLFCLKKKKKRQEALYTKRQGSEKKCLVVASLLPEPGA